MTEDKIASILGALIVIPPFLFASLYITIMIIKEIINLF
jgi:VIT1/CCC1 family predicted Fe2+/Mn2+ transporter